MESIERLRHEFDLLRPLAERLQHALCDEMAQLLRTNRLTLGVPLESRVKDWGSINDKLERKTLQLGTLNELHDLVGIRVILLFRRDVQRVNELLERTFQILSKEDKADLLPESQFGYRSIHYVLRIPDTWRSVPRYADLGELQAEVQTRTLSQHTWAAASHKLQYKREDSVPPPVRRSIHRLSALLETVDLELERVLDERESYVQALGEPPARLASAPQILNVDLLAKITDEMLPPKNKDDVEDYADLLEDLRRFDVNNDERLRSLLDSQMAQIIASDQEQVKLGREVAKHPHRLRIAQGAYFTHAGLVRLAMAGAFAERFTKYNHDKAQRKRAGGSAPKV